MNCANCYGSPCALKAPWVCLLRSPCSSSPATRGRSLDAVLERVEVFAKGPIKARAIIIGYSLKYPFDRLNDVLLIGTQEGRCYTVVPTYRRDAVAK